MPGAARILHVPDRVYYRVELTFLTDPGGEWRHEEGLPYYVRSRSAATALSTFLDEEGARLLGSVTELPGDKASATAWREGRAFVLFAQRGDEAPPRPTQSALRQ